MYFAEIQDKDTDKERVVIKYYSSVTKTKYIHKTTAFLEKYPKSVSKNLKIANRLVEFLNFIQLKINNGNLKSMDCMTIENGSEYLDTIKDSINHADLNALRRLLTKFYYFLAKNDMLRRIKKNDFSFDLKAGKNVLKIPFQ